MNDHKDVALIFDMRSQSLFTEHSLAKSINFSLESLNEETYVNWTQKSKQFETSTSILKNKYQLHGFKRRKRLWVFIIGAHSSKNVDSNVLEMGNYTNKE